MKYESAILKRLIDTYGVVGNPRYISEIIKEFIVRGKERFPNLFTYQADWLAHIDEFGLCPTYTVSYTGQSIYAPNTLERPVKSAILKGQTLVNIITNKTIEQGYINGSTGTDLFSANRVRTKDYINVNGSVTIKCFDNQEIREYLTYKDGVFIGAASVNNNYKVIKSDDTFNQIRITFRNADNSDITPSNLKSVILEGDYTNIDIPYFEGMQSVQMPGLTTTGKNLFDGKLELGQYWDGVCVDNNTAKRNIYPVRVKPNTTYKFSTNIGQQDINVMYHDINKKFISYGGYTSIFNTPSNCHYINFYNLADEHGTGVKLSDYQLQIEEGSTATPYEPYQSNILTVNEDVTLRSNGNICDELNLLTGQLTQRIDEDGEVLSQEIVKTIDLTILDQNGQNVKQLLAFNGGTHFNTGSLEGTPLPSVSVSVETDLEETLAVCSLEGNTM